MNEIKNFKNTDFSDCPKMTKEELKQFKQVNNHKKKEKSLYFDIYFYSNMYYNIIYWYNYKR